MKKRKIPNFTERQMLLLDMIAEEQSIREIARILHCSEDNVKAIRHRVRMQIGLVEGQSLKEWLFQNGWSEPMIEDSVIKELWEKILSKRKIDDKGCWIFEGAKTGGYGVIRVPKTRRMEYVHRISAHVNLNLDLSSKMNPLHKCDNPPCFNPDHLYIGNDNDNQQDRVKRGRHNYSSRTHCNKGHEFTSMNTIYRSDGGRRCRLCQEEVERNRVR